jgi:hypothetical protein
LSSSVSSLLTPSSLSVSSSLKQVLQQSIPIGQNDHTDFSGQIFNINNENGIPQGFNLQRVSPNVLDIRPMNLYSEDAIAAARLMTDMAASKNFTNLPHSNMAETHVTSSGYGYCNPGNHGSFSPEYNRQNNPFQGNVHGHLSFAIRRNIPIFFKWNILTCLSHGIV